MLTSCAFESVYTRLFLKLGYEDALHEKQELLSFLKALMLAMSCERISARQRDRLNGEAVSKHGDLRR